MAQGWSASPLKSFSSPVIHRALLYFFIFTASFEIFLVVNLGGNFKAAQVALILVAFSTLVRYSATGEKLILPNNLALLVAVLFLSLIYVPLSTLTGKSIGYSAWLALDILSVVLFINTFRTKASLMKMLRVFLMSFIFCSGFGISQQMLTFAGIEAPLVTQYWLGGAFARINGFNYEPSFFSTYLMIGWVFCVYLTEHGEVTLGRHLVKVTLWMTTLALFLCSSRMGWLMMILFFCRWPFYAAMHALLRHRVPKPLVRRCVFLALMGSSALIIVLLIFDLKELGIIFNGLGVVEDYGDFSAEGRKSGYSTTFETALGHILFGSGFGGISAEIAGRQGFSITTIEESNDFAGFNVTFELVIAVGLSGMLLMYGYFASMVLSAVSTAKQLTATGDKELAIVVRGLALAFVWQILMLQFNQNILRVYTWESLAVLATAVYAARRSLISSSVNSIAAA
ncbi:MAG: hypothetical protein Q8M37_12090 [Nevskia sp.]|nr:hypothetical protein [Nevskia sp.]